MKWIGQHIYDLTSRFRNDVFLEDISSGTIASGAHLGLDSNNKIVKAADGGGDLTSIVAGTGLSGSDLTGPIPTLNVDASQTHITGVGTIDTGVWEGTDIGVAHGGTGASTLTDNAVLLGNGTGAVEASSHLNYYTPTSNQDYLRIGDGSTTVSGIISSNRAPLFIFVEGNTGTNAAGSDLTLIAGSGTGSGAGGDILFRSSAAGGSGTTVRATAEIASLDNVGNLQIDGGLTTGSTAAITNAGLLSVGNQSNITGLGTVSSGTWNGTAIASAYLDADTAHLAGAQTFTGTKTLNSFKGTAGATVTNILDEDAMGSDSATALATQQSIKAYADTKSLLAGSSSVTTVGTIATGVWEGTAIATDQQKHLMHYEFMGFNNSTADTVYEFAESMNDTKAPLEHTADHNATITTAMVVGTYFKAGGQVIPQAGTIKRIVGWAHSNGTSAEHKLALVMLRPAENDSTAVAPVLVDEVTWTSLGGNKLKAINETTITAAGVNAGDILMTMIKDDTGGRQVYFNVTVELEV